MRGRGLVDLGQAIRDRGSLDSRTDIRGPNFYKDVDI